MLFCSDSSPSSFGSDESIESLDERSKERESEDALNLPKDTADHIPAPKSVTYIDHDNPFSLVDQSSGAPHIRAISPNAWVGCGGDIYVLECMGKGFIRIEPAESEGESTPYFTPHQVFT